MAPPRVQTPQTTAIVPWKERLAAAAAQAIAAEKHANGSNNKIKTSGGIMEYRGAKIRDNKLPAVVVSTMWHNAFYEGSFDANSPASPICYAYSTDGVGMAPHSDSPAPQVDVAAGETCAQCPHNVFGTADKGKGKACKNMRRLGVVGAHELVSIASAEGAVIDVPPGSLKSWKAYSDAVSNTYGIGPIGVITEIALVPEQSGGFSVNFELIAYGDYPEGMIEDGEVINGLFDVADRLILDAPYPVFEAPVKPVRSVRPPVRVPAPVVPRAQQVPVAQRPAVTAPVVPRVQKTPAQRPAAPAQVPIRLPASSANPAVPVRQAVKPPAAPVTTPRKF